MTPYEMFNKCQEEGMHLKGAIILDLLKHMGKTKITDLMAMAYEKGICSQAITHQQVMWLKEYGYILIHEDTQDRRVRECSISRKGKGFLS